MEPSTPTPHHPTHNGVLTPTFKSRKINRNEVKTKKEKVEIKKISSFPSMNPFSSPPLSFPHRDLQEQAETRRKDGQKSTNH